MRCTVSTFIVTLCICAGASAALLFIDNEPRTWGTFARNFAVLGGGQVGSLWYLSHRKRRACRSRGTAD
jgi:hypothetical protein